MNISGQARFNAMAGFTSAHVERAVAELLEGNGRLAGASPVSDRGALLATLTQYHDGYRFSAASRERIFNSDMVLYFLRQLENEGSLPAAMLDPNVRTDYRRLQSMGAGTGAGADVRREVLQTVLSDGHIDSPSSSNSARRASRLAINSSRCSLTLAC